jgi:hypothetical protein
LHPATTVLAPVPGLMDQYKADAYGSYFGTPKLRFPVRPAPPTDGPAPKTPIFAVRNDEGWVAASIPAVVSYGGVGGGWGSVSVSAQTRADPQTVLVTTQPSTDVVYAFWFAWHAFHPETRLVIGAK